MRNGIFNDKLSAEFTPPKTWILERDLTFITKSLKKEDISILQKIGVNISDEGKITCVKGMKTDLASVPRSCWSIISPWDVARAAVIHDHLYATLRKYYHSEKSDWGTWKKGREISDNIFLWGMQSATPSVWKIKTYAAYYAVRAFGSFPASSNEN